MAILTVFKHRFYNNDGTVASGGKVYTYEAGTTTPTATYTDSEAGTPNANPIILDSKGEADIWVVGQIKVNVLESDDTQVTGWPVNNVGSGVSNNDATARWAGTAGGTANALTISPSPSIDAYVIGQSFIFKAGAADNSGATTILVSGLSAIAVQTDGAACAGAEIEASKWYSVVLDTLTTCQLQKIGRGDVVREIHGATAKTTPVAADEVGIWDSVTGLLNRVTWANFFKAPAITSQTISGISGNLYSSTYTPGAATALVNIDAVTPAAAYFTRLGDVVSASGRVSINANAAIAFSFELDLPVASNLGTADQLAGNATTDSPETESCRIYGEATNDTVVFSGIAASTGNRQFSYNYSYRVI